VSICVICENPFILKQQRAKGLGHGRGRLLVFYLCPFIFYLNKVFFETVLRLEATVKSVASCLFEEYIFYGQEKIFQVREEGMPVIFVHILRFGSHYFLQGLG